MSEQYPDAPERRIRHRSDRPAWIGGAILILIGIIFLAQNLTGFSLNNWWALFILIPAVGAFGRVVSIYQAQGRITSAARGSLVGGLVLTFIAAVFLFNLNFSSLWPVFLILGGLGLLVNAMLPND